MQHKNLLSFSNDAVNRIEIKLKRTRLISKPVELMIEPTLQCNSNCVMCNRNFSRKKDKDAEGFLSWDILYKSSSLFKYARRILFSGFGEPLLHPEYAAMLTEIKKHKCFVYMFTNGILLDEVLVRKLTDIGIDMIYVSLGGATKETYQKIRGIDAFEKVIDNLKLLKEYKMKTKKRRPLVAFNIVAMNSILPELKDIIVLAKRLGVEQISLPNLVIQGKGIDQESVWKDIEKSEAIFSKAEKLAKEQSIRFNAPKLVEKKGDCRQLFKQLMVAYDGKVLSCSQERFILGDLNKEPIGSIWNSAGLIKLRKDYYRRGLESLCPNCTCWDSRPETFLHPWLNSREYAQKVFE